MRFLVKVRVDTAKLGQFGAALQANQLDRSLIASETFCLANEPAIGYSIWEAQTAEQFERAFTPWKKFYAETEILPVIGPNEAMAHLLKK